MAIAGGGARHAWLVAGAVASCRVVSGCASTPQAPAYSPLGGADGGAHDAAPALSNGGAARDGGDDLASLEEVAARGGRLAPGMREISRREIVRDASTDAGEDGGSAPADLLRDIARDTCLRVAFAASEKVRARLTTDSGATLAEVAPTTFGALGERGPLCVRRGQRVAITFDGDAPFRVRLVVWAAP